MKKSLSHTVWDCKYHIVWVPKKRRKIVYGKLREETGTILRRLLNDDVLSKRYGNESKSLVSDNYSLERCIDEYQKLFLSVMRG